MEKDISLSPKVWSNSFLLAFDDDVIKPSDYGSRFLFTSIASNFMHIKIE